MLLLDANVLIRCYRVAVEHSAEVRAWLERLIASGTPFGFPDGILMGFVRIVTQKPFHPVTPINSALEFAERVRSVPSCAVLISDSVQWSRFVDVCRNLSAKGKRGTGRVLGLVCAVA